MYIVLLLEESVDRVYMELPEFSLQRVIYMYCNNCGHDWIP